MLWESLHEELRDPDAERIKRLSKRLSDVSATVGMLAQTAHTAPVERRTPPEPVRLDPVPEERPSPELRLAPHLPPSAPRVEPSRAADSQPPTSFERTPRPEPRVAPSRPPEPESPVALKPIEPSVADYTFTRLVDEHESVPTGDSYVGDRRAGVVVSPQIEAHDVRREEGPAAWVTSVGRLLQRQALDGLPFAVLLIEIVDVARLERSETPHDLHGIVRQVESALGRGMRATDELSRETLGRYWLAASDTDTSGARMLAERLAHLVRTTATQRDVPLEVAIGIAMCPHDGTDAPALAARADLGVYSARANGRSVAHTDLPQG